MANLVEVGKTSEMKDGTLKKVIIDEREILLSRIGKDYYAADNRCPHMRGRLSQGKLEGTVVTCPLHGSQFDLKTGEVVRWLSGSGLLSGIGKALKPPKSLTTYKVKVEGDRVMVEI